MSDISYLKTNDSESNINFRTVEEIQGPPEHGRGAGVNPLREVYHKVKIHISSGNIVFETH